MVMKRIAGTCLQSRNKANKCRELKAIDELVRERE